jgi:uncharacterized membrane protein YbhN (UPF0104 family)
MVVILSLLLAISVAAWYGRWHLLTHHPEHYARFDVAERAFAKAAVAATERAVRGLVAAIKGMGRLLTSKKA